MCVRVCECISECSSNNSTDLFSPSSIKLMKCYKCYRILLTIARYFEFSFALLRIFSSSRLLCSLRRGGKAALMLLLILSGEQSRKSDWEGEGQVLDSGSTNKPKLFR